MIIVLLGKSSSGKDTVAKILSKTYEPVVYYTTRPMRKGEVNGKDYYFVTKEEFDKLDLLEKRVFHTKFGDWYYGTPLEIKDGSLIICSPEQYKLISDKYDCIAFYINVDFESRYNAAIKRGDDANEFTSREERDKPYFEKLENVIEINNNEYKYSPEELAERIKKICEN